MYQGSVDAFAARRAADPCNWRFDSSRLTAQWGWKRNEGLMVA